MADQGSGGAYEISQRMTAMMGWGATAKFSEGWVWDQAADTYALDSDMAAKLRKNNPQVPSKQAVMSSKKGLSFWSILEACLGQQQGIT